MIEADVRRRMERHPAPEGIDPVEIERQALDLLMSLYGGMAPSTSTLGRAPKELLAVWEANRAEIDAEAREGTAAQLPSESAVATIAFSLDGVMLPMKSAPRSKEPTGPNGYREASTAPATLYNDTGHRLFTVYLGRMPEKTKVSLHGLLSEEVAFLVARYPAAELLAVAGRCRHCAPQGQDRGHLKQRTTRPGDGGVRGLSRRLLLAFRTGPGGPRGGPHGLDLT